MSTGFEIFSLWQGMVGLNYISYIPHMYSDGRPCRIVRSVDAIPTGYTVERLVHLGAVCIYQSMSNCL